MRNSINNNDIRDDFTERIRLELENHRMPVDSDCWSEIEARIKPKSSGNKKIYWMWESLAAVAVILILLLVYPFKEVKTDKNSLKQIPTVSDKKVEVGNKFIVEKVNESQNKKQTRKISKTAVKKYITTNISDTIKSEQSNINNTEKTIEKEDIKTDDKLLIAEKKQEDSNEKDRKKQDELFLKNEPNEIILPAKNNNKWLLATVIGSGNGIPSNNSSLDYGYNSQNMNNGSIIEPEKPYDFYNSILSPEDFSDIKHSTPLSGGITVRKNLNKHIGIESGVIYTYLYSTFDKPGLPRYTGKLNLHYLGVPLNLVGYIWKDNNWNIYLTGGGMVEKGLSSVYNQKIYKTNEIIETSARTNIDGLQWSLNASIGASYRFYEKWHLYAEPRISYYFDNNQPISIRTEESTVFGINAGFRYEF